MKWRAAAACVLLGWTATGVTGERALQCFPSGQIYEYRWKLLELTLEHVKDAHEPIRLRPYAEDITQNRAAALLQSGGIDVLALGTNPEREASLRPVRIDILKGIVGFRMFLIRGSEQPRMARMSETAVKQQLTFRLLRDWADLPIMTASGFKVETATEYANLFAMLDAGRFDAFPRGLNEVLLDLAIYQKAYPGLAPEETKALYFPFPIYFWVSWSNTALAERIEIRTFLQGWPKRIPPGGGSTNDDHASPERQPSG